MQADNFGFLRDQYVRDADSILDGIEFDHKKAARDEDDMNSSISAVFCLKEQDEKEMNATASAYANGQSLPRLRSAQRWRFAMRLRFAAALLSPFDKREIKSGSQFYKRVSYVQQADLTLWLLTDGMLFCRETFNEIAYTSERDVSAPMRPPWKPNLSIKKCVDESAKVEEKL